LGNAVNSHSTKIVNWQLTAGNMASYMSKFKQAMSLVHTQNKAATHTCNQLGQTNILP